MYSVGFSPIFSYFLKNCGKNKKLIFRRQTNFNDARIEFVHYEI